MLEDTQLIETLAHFPRERIPERFNGTSLSAALANRVAESSMPRPPELGVNSNVLAM